MRYFRFELDDTPEGPRANWGHSMILMLEIDEQGATTRQLEVYRKGRVVAYDAEHSSDEYGYLDEERVDLEDLQYIEAFEIPRTEFERAWRNLKPLNR